MTSFFDSVIRRRIRYERRRKLVIVRRNLRDLHNPFKETTDQQFIDLYRFPEGLCLELLDKMKRWFFLNERETAIPGHLRLLCALRFFASGSFQRTVGQDFMACMSQTSIHRCIHEVADILNAISKDYVYFPDEREQATIAPGRDIEQAYYCRKGGHSINVLLVCDSKHIIRYANVKLPGTSHDAYIWRRSALQDFFKTKYERGKRNFWLLGDSGFPQQPWLMTPFSSPSNAAEENYNNAHKKTRCMVERCIGILKMRFRCVSSGRILHYILHNILQRANVPLPNSELVEEIETEATDLTIHHSEGGIDMLREGQINRQDIVRTYFS